MAFLLAFGSSAGATARAVASVSIFGVFIVSAPSTAITAVRTSIALKCLKGKVIIPKFHLGEGLAMGSARCVRVSQADPE